MKTRTRRLTALSALVASALAAGCMPDSVLTEREETVARLRAEARTIAARVAGLEGYETRLRAAIRSGKAIGGAEALLRDLGRLGLAVEKGSAGKLRLSLGREFLKDLGEGGGELGPVAASRLAQAAALLRARLPDHELSVEATHLGHAVAAVRILHEQARVPGTRLRACLLTDTARAGGSERLVVEVRPTRIETLREVLAATSE